MTYDTRTITAKFIMPEGYYDEFGDLTDEGMLVVSDMLEEAGFTVDTIEQ